MVKELRFNNPKNVNKILASNFWWNMIIHPWHVGFLKSKTTEFHGLGWVSMSDVWVAFVGIFASKEEMGKKIMLSLEEELGYERIITKLEEAWGGLLKEGDNHCKEGDWFAKKINKMFLSMVCHASFTFKLECNNNVQHLYILQNIKLYIVGSQSRTLNFINDGEVKIF
jgi:hypothetical protein